VSASTSAEQSDPAVPPTCQDCGGQQWTVSLRRLGRRIVCDGCDTSMPIADWELYYGRPATAVR